MIRLPIETEVLARRIAVARGLSLEDAVAWAIEEGARATEPAPARRRMTPMEMLAVGGDITEMPLLDGRAPHDIAEDVNAT